MSSQPKEALPFNLEQYFSKLTLKPITHGADAPPMPPHEARSTLMPLTLKPAGYRKLREMHRFDLSKKIVKYFSKFETVEGDAFRTLRHLLEHDSNCDSNNPFSPYLIASVSNLENLLFRLLFRIQEVLDSLDGSMRDWSFETFHLPRNDGVDTQPLHPILYRLPGPSAFKPSSVKLVILPMCPWEFAPRDFVEFTTIGRFDDIISTEWQSRSWVNADMMWAHLYDVCLYYECPLFVVTSYEQWIFGRFSKHYTNAWFSPILSFDNKPVSIVETLTFWIHASFSKEDTFTPPKIYSERQLTDAHLETEVQTHTKRYMDDGFSGTGPDLNTEDVPAAKRRRIAFQDDASTKAATKPTLVKRERHRRPPPLWKELRALQRKRRANGRLSLGKAESSISIAPSVAPSSADPLPEAMIPRSRNDWCERWRNMVAMGEDNTNTQQLSKEVTLQVFDPITGDETGDFVHVEDHTCPSCCSSSPTLSACSLSEEELERWKPMPMDDFDNYGVYQWNEDRLEYWAGV